VAGCETGERAKAFSVVPAVGGVFFFAGERASFECEPV
jgi:hypothetical protein